VAAGRINRNRSSRSSFWELLSRMALWNWQYNQVSPAIPHLRYRCVASSVGTERTRLANGDLSSPSLYTILDCRRPHRWPAGLTQRLFADCV